MPYAGRSKTDPKRRKQLTAIFLSIQRRKGTAAAKAEYRKQQREGYAPTAKKKKRLADHMVEQRKRGGRRSSRA